MKRFLVVAIILASQSANTAGITLNCAQFKKVGGIWQPQDAFVKFPDYGIAHLSRPIMAGM